MRLKENKSMEESGKSGKRVPGRLLITTTVGQGGRQGTDGKTTTGYGRIKVTGDPDQSASEECRQKSDG